LVAGGCGFEELDQCGAFAALEPEEVELSANVAENAARTKLFDPNAGGGTWERHRSMALHVRKNPHCGGAPSLSMLVVRSLNTFARHGCWALAVHSCGE
jgi:hypothetical protein